MSKEHLKNLGRYIGVYQGSGINHERQPFTGRLVLKSLLNGLGYELEFTATGEQGEIFHSEISTLTLTAEQKLGLWHLSTNTPFMLQFALNQVIESRYQFSFGVPEDKKSFREQIDLELLDNQVGYHFSWGLPGADFGYRSGVVMTRMS